MSVTWLGGVLMVVWPWLVKLLIGGVLLSGIALLIGGALFRGSAVARERTWRVAVLAMLGFALLPLVVSWRWRLPVAVEILAAVPPEGAGAFAAGSEPPPRPPAGAALSSTTAGGEDLTSGRRARVHPADAGRFDAAGRSSSPAAALAVPATLLWAVVSAALLMHLALGRAALWLHARRADDVTATLAPSLGTNGPRHRRLRVLRGGPFRVPVCWGVLQPTILLPPGSEAWSRERTRAVLLHEVAHANRLDALFHLVGRMACALHWPSPIAWLLQARLLRDAEAACDAAVVDAGVEARTYARALIEMAEEARRGPRTAIALGFVRARSLGWRVVRILDGKRDRRARPVLTAAASVALVAAAFAGATAHPSPRPVRGQAPAAAQQAPTDTLRQMVVRALVGALADPDPDVRRSAMNSLRDIGDAAGLEAVRALLDDPEPELRIVAAEVLGMREPRPNLALPRSGPAGRPSRDALQRLVGRLEAADAGTRVRAANALGNHRDPRAVPDLVRRLVDRSADVRRAAANALGNIGSTEAVAALQRAYPDDEADVRRAIAAALGNLGDARAVPMLMAAAADPDAGVRQAIASALGAIADPRAVPTLVLAVRDPDEAVRRQAAESLGKVWVARSPATGAGGVSPVAGNSSGNRETAAGGATAAIAPGEGARDPSAPDVCVDDASAVEPRQTLADASRMLREDPDAARRAAAARTIGRLAAVSHPPPPSAEPDPKGYHHALVAGASDPATQVRLAAICALGRVGGTGALEVLGWRRAEREGPSVREAATWAITRIRERDDGESR